MSTTPVPATTLITSTSDLSLSLSAAEALIVLDALDAFHEQQGVGPDGRFRGEASRVIAARLRARATRNDSYTANVR